MVTKWKINGIELPRNPDSFVQRPEKNVSYQKSVSGDEIRLIPPERPVDMYLEIGWSRADESLRNMLHDLYMQDKKFTLQSHLSFNPRDTWTVKIDEFSATYVRGGPGQRFDINMTLKVLNGANDPILSNRYTSAPYLFVIDNKTNRDVYDFLMFLYSKDKPIVNPTIRQTFLNLLENPGFEDAVLFGDIPKWSCKGTDWETDIIYFLEGQKCVKTYQLNSPISQEVVFPEGQEATVLWAVMGDNARADSVELNIEWLDATGTVLDTFSDVRSTTKEWQTFWGNLPASPLGTKKARVSIKKIAGVAEDSDYVYIDTIMLRLGTSERQPEFSSQLHRVMSYDGTIAAGNILKMDCGARTASLNNIESVNHLLKGNFFPLPVGRSMIVVTDENEDAGTTEVVIRFDEIWE